MQRLAACPRELRVSALFIQLLCLRAPAAAQAASCCPCKSMLPMAHRHTAWPAAVLRLCAMQNRGLL